MGDGGVAISPAHGSSSYSNPNMTFYLNATPGGVGTLQYASPISGTTEFVYKNNRWSAADGTDLEGLVVRDFLRVFGGVLSI